MKKYRVNNREYFNLVSMQDKLEAQRILAIEDDDFEVVEKIEQRLDEVENLLDKAYCVGALVTWNELARIREIADEREYIRSKITGKNGCI